MLFHAVNHTIQGRQLGSHARVEVLLMGDLLSQSLVGAGLSAEAGTERGVDIWLLLELVTQVS